MDLIIALIALIGATLRISTPILYGALGEMIVERSGVLNLGIEGTMLLSAFSGFVAAQLSGSLYVGLLAAVMTGVLLSLLMGLLTGGSPYSLLDWRCSSSAYFMVVQVFHPRWKSHFRRFLCSQEHRWNLFSASTH
jgi:hypothetical protein